MTRATVSNSTDWMCSTKPDAGKNEVLLGTVEHTLHLEVCQANSSAIVRRFGHDQRRIMENFTGIVHSKKICFRIASSGEITEYFSVGDIFLSVSVRSAANVNKPMTTGAICFQRLGSLLLSTSEVS
jgi:hypothetical protein